MINKKRVLAMMAILLIASLTTASCNSPSETGPRVGAIAPDFTLPTLEGGSLTLSDLKGKPVLINFWATWCDACRYEMPFLQAAHDQYRDQGLVIVGVNLSESRPVIQSFMKSLGLTFAVALDGGNQVTGLYRVGPLPTTFLIDREGVIRVKKVGAFFNLAELQSSLKSIM